ncbi:MAG: hypothetical protein WC542_04290 [Paludibacter sp.]|jgi:hypothetical protein
MKLFKLLDQLEKSFTSGRKFYNRSTWTGLKTSYNRNQQQKFGVHTLNMMILHERNGSRGEGIGMGRRNKPTRTN